MPFRFGITTMTRVPHLFLQAQVEIDGRLHTGVSADHLPPKWFTKDPASLYRDDVADMLTVIAHACELALESDASESLFGVVEVALRGAEPLG
jgi:hypothetical protein